MYLVDQLDFLRQEKNQIPLPLASKFWSWISESRCLVVKWTIEISLSSPVSLSESVSFVNGNFQTETTLKLTTAKWVLQRVESIHESIF